VEIRQLEAEADEPWSFVAKKVNKQWLWIAMDATTRQSIAFHRGAAVVTVLKSCGPISPRSTVNRPRFIRTDMKPIKA
jgi:hypothetical protein